MTKSTDPATLLLSEGQAATVDYTVSATRGEGVDSDWAVSGDIVGSQPVEQGGDDLRQRCAAERGRDLPDDHPARVGHGHLHLRGAGRAGAARTNTATVTALYTSAPRTVTASAYSFGSPTTTVDATATLSDQLTCPAGFSAR